MSPSRNNFDYFHFCNYGYGTRVYFMKIVINMPKQNKKIIIHQQFITNNQINKYICCMFNENRQKTKM